MKKYRSSEILKFKKKVNKKAWTAICSIYTIFHYNYFGKMTNKRQTQSYDVVLKTSSIHNTDQLSTIHIKNWLHFFGRQINQFWSTKNCF
jgi:hypothetical protein